MRKILEYSLAGVLSFLFSRAFIHRIVLPTLWGYPRLTRVMARFPKTTLFDPRALVRLDSVGLKAPFTDLRILDL